jgi:hypothetical protein
VKRGPSSLDPTGHRHRGGFTYGRAVLSKRQVENGSEAHLPTANPSVEQARAPLRAAVSSPGFHKTGAHVQGLRVSGLGNSAPLRGQPPWPAVAPNGKEGYPYDTLPGGVGTSVTSLLVSQTSNQGSSGPIR